MLRDEAEEVARAEIMRSMYATQRTMDYIHAKV